MYAVGGREARHRLREAGEVHGKPREPSISARTREHGGHQHPRRATSYNTCRALGPPEMDWIRIPGSLTQERALIGTLGCFTLV